MLKYSLYLFLLALSIFTYYFFGTNIALPIVGLVLVFLVLINYLRSHTIAIEEHDFSDGSKLNKPKNQASPRLQKKKTIPVDPKIIAMYSKKSASISNKTKEYASPIVLNDTNKEKIDDFGLILNKDNLKHKSKQSEKEKVFVSISPQAKDKYKNITPLNKGSNNYYKQNIPNKNSDLIDSIPIASNTTSKSNKNTINNPNQSNIEISKTKPTIPNIKSIFDDLTTENNVYFSSDEVTNSDSKNYDSQQSKKENYNNYNNKSTFKNDIKFSQSSKKEIIEEISDLSNAGLHNDTNNKIFEYKKNDEAKIIDSKSAKKFFINAITDINTNKPEIARGKLLDYFSNYISNDDPVFEADLTKVCDVYRKNNYHQFALPFFITLLSIKRNEKNRNAMDNLYDDIIKAYSATNQKDKLIESYQNQLAIRKKLEDLSGQLSILDELGKLYFDIKDNVGVNYCYQQAMEIRKQMLNNK